MAASNANFASSTALILAEASSCSNFTMSLAAYSALLLAAKNILRNFCNHLLVMLMGALTINYFKRCATLYFDLSAKLELPRFDRRFHFLSFL